MKTAVLRILVKSGFVLLGIMVIASGLQLMVRYQSREKIDLIESIQEEIEIYRKYSVKSWGWELGKPRPILVEFVEKGLIKKGKTLDLCCGAGTNTIYLAKKVSK